MPLPTPTVSSCGPLPEITVSDQACGLCNTEKIPDLIDDPMSSAFPDGVPDIFIKIIQKAGETFGVPAALIFGTIYHEGAFSGGVYQYTDANVRAWSACGGTMPNCDKNSSSTQTPFGWIPHYFYDGEGESAMWNAIQKIDPNRTKENTSPCNFADGIFATAKALKMWTYARAPDFDTTWVTGKHSIQSYFPDNNPFITRAITRFNALKCF